MEISFGFNGRLGQRNGAIACRFISRNKRMGLMKETNANKSEIDNRAEGNRPDRDAKSADRKPEMAAASKGIAVEGTVKSFDDGKGFGFITPADGGKDLFAHHSEIKNNGGFRTLAEGAQVEFEVKQGPKGLQAANIRAL